MIDINKFNAAIVLKGETKEDAARIMGICYPTLTRKIGGSSDFYRKEIEAFCKHYSVSPNDIFFAREVT